MLLISSQHMLHTWRNMCVLLYGRMAEEKLDQRIQLVASKQFIAAVDDWRRTQPGIPSRSEAIRQLTWRALNASKKPDETQD